MSSTTVNITAADVNKLRTQTGAGMMDCKKALTEAEGDFEKAVDILRKKGQKVAANRGDREAKEGYVIAKLSDDKKFGSIISLNCETDFVAINADFTAFANKISDTAMANKPADLEALKALSIDGRTIAEHITDYVGKIGEKIELGKYEFVVAECVTVYNHPGNRVATIVGFNKSTDEQVMRDVAMQAAAMAPVALDKDQVDASILEREIEIGKEQARAEGKPEEMLEKIAMGKLNKFYKESTLLNQDFIKDNKKTVAQYMNDSDKGLTATGFKRVALG
jgi:elongation factor Ts